MKLEIIIETEHRFKGELLAELAAFAPQHKITATAAGGPGNRCMLRFPIIAEKPDPLLQQIGAVLARIETLHPGLQDMTLLVKNAVCAEPSWDTLQNGSAFSPAQGIRILPWHGSDTPASAGHDIFLQPTQAFGTGQHPSTRLCLGLLPEALQMLSEQQPPKAPAVLDIGCGSGILSLAAARQGAGRVLALEINAGAVEAARRNVELNRLADRIQVIKASWHEAAGRYDLVLANLVPSVLFKALPHLASLVRKKGLLITAGFSMTKNREMLGLLALHNMRLAHESSLDGWGALMAAAL